jgi:hypothetical protein
MQEVVVERVSVAASGVTYGGAVSAVAFGFTTNELLGIGGLAIGLAGFAVNWHYKRKHYALALAQTEALTGKNPEQEGEEQ